MKYRLKYHDTSWLFFTPFAFLNMGGNTNLWTIECKKHWWNKWKVIERYEDEIGAYIHYMKLAYNMDFEEEMEFPHNRNKHKKQTCVLTLKYDSNPISPEYKYTAGYKPVNYKNYYFACYSGESYEDALGKLWCDLEVRKILWRNESYMSVEKQRRELEKFEYENKIY